MTNGLMVLLPNRAKDTHADDLYSVPQCDCGAGTPGGRRSVQIIRTTNLIS